MWEFQIWNEKTNQHRLIWGYTEEDAWEHSPEFSRSEWKILYSEYMD